MGIWWWFSLVGIKPSHYTIICLILATLETFLWESRCIEVVGVGEKQLLLNLCKGEHFKRVQLLLIVHNQLLAAGGEDAVT